MAKTSDAVTQRGLKALELVTEHRAALEGRLDAGAIDALRGNLERLGVAVPGQLAARATSKSATVTQAKALETAAQFVTAIRASVRSNDGSAAKKKAYGVGNRLDPRVPKSVAAAVAGVMAAWNADPDGGRALGILDRDIAALTSAAAAAKAADEDQDQKRARAPVATKVRNAASKAVEGAVRRIAAAGALEFATEAGVREQFEALVAGTPKSKKSAPTPPA